MIAQDQDNGSEAAHGGDARRADTEQENENEAILQQPPGEEMLDGDLAPLPEGSHEGLGWGAAVVGIGASAGGLKPLTTFFDEMSSDSGLTFVVIQHLSPHSPSLLPDLLRRHTEMEVRQAEEGVPVGQNEVWVIPPGYDLVLRGGLIHLLKREGPDELHLPIDLFFRSLAQDRGTAGIGIILSGAGADGALGLRAIKEHGGLAIVQEPSTAEHVSMPRNAIETGLVDYILPPDDMPHVLLNYVAYLRQERLVPQLNGLDATNALQRILIVLRARTGHDFGLYKRSTVLRRIERRMLLRQVEGLDDYARYLHRNPDEVRTLVQEMLIGVTEFFRDPDAFETLKNLALPTLLEGRSSGDPLRVWVPACATGEEAYSLAVLIQEYLDEHKCHLPVQIFATDINEEAIDKARRGAYPHTIAACISAQRLERFFIRVENEYQVVEAVRKLVVFAPHSIIKDPPFSHIDLASCRNLLIYLEPELQHTVLRSLAYALKPGGFLFLGTSETPAQLVPHFETVDRKWRIYHRLESRAELRGLPELRGPANIQAGLATTPAAAQRIVTRQVVERLLLESYLSPSLIVDREGEILFIYGRTGRYLEPVAGQAGPWHVVRMLHEGLRMPLMSAIRRAAMEGRTIRHERLRFDLEGHDEFVDVTVTPLDPLITVKGLCLVMLQEPHMPQEADRGTAAEPAPASRSQREAEMEKELQSTREYLQATIEELQSSNEEIWSTNEELQSTNEELETAQEESQSINEELATLNTQLQAKLEELQAVNDDMNNLLTSIDVGLIFLDRRFHIRRFNQAATRVVNLIPGDVGRPIGHISSQLRDNGWIAAASVVFESLKPHEQEVQSEDGHWYLVRIQPYRTVEDVIDGIVLTFTDISGQKQVEEFTKKVVDTVRQPLVILDADLRVQQANRAFYQTFRLEMEETEGHLIYELNHHQWDIPRLRELLEEIIPQNATFEGFALKHDFKGLGQRQMVLNARRLDASNGQPDLILLAIEEKE